MSDATDPKNQPWDPKKAQADVDRMKAEAASEAAKAKAEAATEAAKAKAEAGKAAEKNEPFHPEGVGPAAPVDNTPNRWAPAEGTPAPRAGMPGSPYTPPRPKRTSEQIRADIDAQREELGGSVDALRDKVTEITDWRSQLRKHRKPIIVGAVATGFIVGGLMALRRR